MNGVSLEKALETKLKMSDVDEEETESLDS